MIKKLLELLERIAIALETIANIEYSPKSLDNEVKLIEEPDKETIEEETLVLRTAATTLITENPTNQVWAEDNLTNDQLESLE